MKLQLQIEVGWSTWRWSSTLTCSYSISNVKKKKKTPFRRIKKWKLCKMIFFKFFEPCCTMLIRWETHSFFEVKVLQTQFYWRVGVRRRPSMDIHGGYQKKEGRYEEMNVLNFNISLNICMKEVYKFVKRNAKHLEIKVTRGNFQVNLASTSQSSGFNITLSLGH